MTKPLSMEAAIDLYLASLEARNYSTRTVPCYRSDLRRLLEFLDIEGVASPGDVTREILVRFQAWLHSEYRSLRGRPITTGSQLNVLATMRAFYAHLASEKLIAADPASTVELPKVRRRLPREIPTEGEVERLLEAPDVTRSMELRDRAMLEMFYGAGIRRSELYQLSIHDVDLERAEVRVEAKKGGVSRVIPIPPIVCHWVRRYTTEVRPRLVGPWSRDILFLTRLKKPFRSGWFVKLVKRYGARAQIAKDPKCHGLRHAYGTHLLQRGMGIRHIQKLLGHRSIASTQVYTQLSPTDLSEAFHRAHPRSNESQESKGPDDAK